MNFLVPRIPDRDHLRRELRRAVLDLGSTEDSSPEGGPSTSKSEDESATEDATPSVDETYPLLKDFGIDTDLSKKDNANYIMDLAGECFNLQATYDNDSKTLNRYRRRRQEKITYTISLIHQKKEESFT